MNHFRITAIFLLTMLFCKPGAFKISAQGFTEWAHYEKLDTAKFGFAYIINENDKSLKDNVEKKFVLLIGDKYMRFCDVNIYKTDSLFSKKGLRDVSQETLSAAIKSFSEADYGEILIDINKNEYKYIINSFEGAGYKESIPQIEWELIDGDSVNYKKHPGMTLKKAKANFGGRLWHALYNPEIPFPYGPYFFGGLPGLIVSLWDEERDFIIDLAPEFNMKVDNILRKTDDVEIEMMTREKFYKYHWHYNKEGGAYENLNLYTRPIPGQPKPKIREFHYVPLMK